MLESGMRESTEELTDPVELRNLLGEVGSRAANKERVTLHPRDRDWIAATPFLVMSERSERSIQHSHQRWS